MIIGRSPQWLALMAQLHRFASCDLPVLLEGETGTGKELAAREIHYSGPRANQPFVPVNCGALPDSLIESELFGHRRGAFTDAKVAQAGLVGHARGGTLFLDEVDTLSPKAQVTMLRFLQDHQYRPVGGGIAHTANVRVIAASNACLDHLTASGDFRRDLLYRLNALYARLPALRDREGDPACLAEHFLAVAAQQLGTPRRRWTGDALGALCAYAWPGNVRELENLVLRACLQADTESIGLEELAAVEPALVKSPVAAEGHAGGDAATFCVAKTHAVEKFELGYLTALMRRTRGNISKAALLSGTERRQLGKLLKKHGIQRQQFSS
jgi:DNA-binding NtrC family response regulator